MSFVCWPGAHKPLIDPDQPWLPEIDPAQFVQVPGSVGSLLFWHYALPHGNGRNTSNKPRLAQYMDFYPAPDLMDEERRQERISLWWERHDLGRGAYPGDSRGWEASHYGPTELTALGRELLGIGVW